MHCPAPPRWELCCFCSFSIPLKLPGDVSLSVHKWPVCVCQPEPCSWLLFLPSQAAELGESEEWCTIHASFCPYPTFLELSSRKLISSRASEGLAESTGSLHHLSALFGAEELLQEGFSSGEQQQGFFWQLLWLRGCFGWC